MGPTGPSSVGGNHIYMFKPNVPESGNQLNENQTTFASWGNNINDFVYQNFTINTINSKQLMIRYDNGGIKSALTVLIGDTFVDDIGTERNRNYIVVFQIIALDVANNKEYVLASYKDESFTGFDYSREYYLNNTQIFITPSKTTLEYYFPVTELTPSMSGQYFCVNGLGVLGSRTTNFIGIGATVEPTMSGATITNPIFRYNGLAPTIAGVFGTTGTIIKVIIASDLVINRYYVIKVVGTVNWALIGAANPIVVGTLFKYNGAPKINGTTGCCLETTDLDLTGMKLIARASVSTAGCYSAVVENINPSYLTTMPLADACDTTYVARRQSSIGANVNQTNEILSGGSRLVKEKWRMFPISEFPLLFSSNPLPPVTLPATFRNSVDDIDFIIKYLADGTADWATTIPVLNSFYNSKIVTDSMGDIYITGSYNSGADFILPDTSIILPQNNGNLNPFIIKYSVTDRTVHWAQTIPVTGTLGFGTGIKIAIDSTGHVYITGFYKSTEIITFPGSSPAVTLPASSSILPFIIKYSTSDGIAKWAKTFQSSVGTAVIIGEGYGIATDSTGNVYITGTYRSTEEITLRANPLVTLPASPTSIPFIIKYSTSDGIAKWAKTFQSAGTVNGSGLGIATDSAGNVYISGNYGSDALITFPGSLHTLPLSSTSSPFIIKYETTTGIAQWANTFISSAGAVNGIGHGIATDSAGDVYITGAYKSNAEITFPGSSPAVTLPLSITSIPFIIKYDTTTGIAQWANTFQATGNSVGWEIATDSAGDVYITGNYTSPAEITLRANPPVTLPKCLTNAAFIIKYSSSHGIAQEAKIIQGTGSSGGTGITTDSDGNVCVIGKYNSSTTILL